jgi:hypothetical protein
MITLCILLYVLGALPVYAIAYMVRNEQNKNIDLVIVSAIWPLTVVYGVAIKVYLSLKEQ